MPTRMIMNDGTFVWPQYCNDNERTAIKNKLENQHIRMFCGCRKDITLEYKISADLRFIPLHLGYSHAAWCDRCDASSRNVAYAADECGDVRAHLSFDYRSYSHSQGLDSEQNEKSNEPGPNAKTDGQESIPSEAANRVKHAKGDKLAALNLNNFICTLNRDTYMSRIKENRYVYLSRSYYYNAVLGRIRRIRLNRASKTISEMNIDTDGVSFFYAPLRKVSDKGLIFSFKDKEYNFFIFDDVLERATKKFCSAYKVSVEESLSTGTEVIAAGFRYKRRNKNGTEYKVVGRLVLFMSNKYGLYASDMQELHLLDAIMDYCRTSRALFIFPDNPDAAYIGTILHKGHETVIYPADCNDDRLCNEFDNVCMLHNRIPSADKLSKIIL